MEDSGIVWVEYTKRSSEMTAKGLSLDWATQKPMITLTRARIPVIIQALWGGGQLDPHITPCSKIIPDHDFHGIIKALEENME